MKVEHLNPFVNAALDTMRTMLGIEARRGPLSIKSVNTTNTDLTAIIGLSGKLRGSIVLTFDEGVAEKLVQKFLGSTSRLSQAEICDGIGELCNIVGGSAKVELNKLGLNLSISIPNVIIGKGLQIANNPSYPTLVVPFDSMLGHFCVEVCLME